MKYLNPTREQPPYSTTRKLFGWLTSTSPAEMYQILNKPLGHQLSYGVLMHALHSDDSPVRLALDAPHAEMARSVLGDTVSDIYSFTRIALTGRDPEVRQLISRRSPLVINILGELALLPNEDIQTFMFVQERLAREGKLSLESLQQDPFMGSTGRAPWS